MGLEFTAWGLRLESGELNGKMGNELEYDCFRRLWGLGGSLEGVEYIAPFLLP